MSIIAAGTTTTTALSSTGNTDGTLQFQVNGTTPSVTLNTLGAIGVGSTPNYGTSGQALVSAGSTAAPTWASVTTSPAGSNTQIQYNNSGSFGASSALTFDGTNLAVIQSGNPTMTVKTTGAGNNPLYRLQADTNYWDALGVFSDSNDTLRFRYNGTDYLTLTNAGAIGVGSGISYGSSGQVLTSGGSGAAPTWSTPSSGALTLIATQTPSGQADPTFTTGISSTYKVYKLYVQIYASDSSNFTPFIRVYANGAVDTNSAYGGRYLNGSTYTNSAGNTYSPISQVGTGSSVLTAWTYEITVYANFSQSSPYYLTYYTSGNTSSYANLISAGGYYDGASGRNGTITGIQVMTNGTPVNGRVSLYGVS
jgi:hypothetical protein